MIVISMICIHGQQALVSLHLLGYYYILLLFLDIQRRYGVALGFALGEPECTYA